MAKNEFYPIYIEKALCARKLEEKMRPEIVYCILDVDGG